MKIFFGEAKNIVEDDDFGTFTLVDTNNNTRYFFAAVEHGECFDDVTIFDNCGRSVPISLDTVPELVQALSKCYANYRKLQKAQELQETIKSNSWFFVEKETDHELVIHPAV